MKAQLPFINSNQRKGILALVCLIVLLQIFIFWFKRADNNAESTQYIVDVKTQQQIDSLKIVALKEYEPKPFNPNFVKDGKWFQLGMSTEEIDRLLKFRASGKYVNSAVDFQKVTGVSNELLAKIAPQFQFPEWTQNEKQETKNEAVVVNKMDLNKATLQDLMDIKGIGDYFANAILAEREKLNGFVSIQQVDFIKGLRPEAINIIKQTTFVKSATNIVKVNVNTATKEQLTQVPYLNSYLAREIVVLRSKQETALKIEDLEKINNFPLDKLKIIRLYLDF
ncbi:helix-hairpin-helix domain-containing protein [Flavobacterium sp. xlx-214]|uniref:ComEA family DNA-binding protein n=1 Tax=unclassified Flavobacterium TaxID=196869 RepID=UPI0013D3B632|nr:MULTISPECIES: helix-hairpin-helix domain-containing protein [unclassified Flavobacterium]MBA5793413.1 helix-hairpin-helix domain-containing protein [Flavobacterium sp. xlx-221]QMI84027.1 helix-hairpin-helix domain-containing protein [Flavobacterium sp. xlx-214]